MAGYRLSFKAAADIRNITRSSTEQWGAARGEQYALELKTVFQRLAEFPTLGLDVGYIRSGYLRMRSFRHTIFYRKIDNGVLILRVLHQSMDVDRHL